MLKFLDISGDRFTDHILEHATHWYGIGLLGVLCPMYVDRIQLKAPLAHVYWQQIVVLRKMSAVAEFKRLQARR
jgi:hypothetical protein